MLFGAILAGGVGSRMNIDSMPKQFLPLGSKPIFMHTLEKFLLCDQFDAVYLGVHGDWVDFVEDALSTAGLADAPVRVVKGGADRNGTIMSIIEGIEREFGESDEHVIVTHDSVRPFVKLSTIRANIDAMAHCDACDTVIPATDTIVCSEGGEFIDSIPVRDFMFQGQTPQTFRINALKCAFAELTEDEKSVLTDACKMLVLKGRPVAMVEGDVTNIKLTTIMDYKVAQAMLESGAE